MNRFIIAVWKVGSDTAYLTETETEQSAAELLKESEELARKNPFETITEIHICDTKGLILERSKLV